MPPKAKSRSLPKDKNSLLHPPDDQTSLLRKCKEQKVLFDTFSLYVVRLKLPTPVSPGSESIGPHRFITRMRDSDFFQALSLFEVAFPFATDKEREAEKAHIEKTYRVITDTDVKGLWITSDTASQLAKEYHLEPYINALKAASPGKPADSLTPVKGNVAHENAPASVKGPSSVQSTPVVAPEVPSAALRRSRRSASPKKQAAARAPRAPSSKAGSTSGRGRKKKGSVVDDESIASTSPAVPHVVPEELLVRAEGAVEKADAEDGKPILDTIKVDQNDTTELLAVAKAQVEAARAEEKSAPPTTRVKRALEIDEESPAEEATVKRARVDDLEKEVWYDNRRGRALLGLAIGLGASVVLPYLV